VADGVPDGLRIASLGRRHVAALVDGASLLSVFVFVIVAGVARVLGRPDGDSPDDDSAHDKWMRRLSSRRARIGIAITHCASVVLLRNWHSPGMRMAGIRRVDARTRGPITARSALIEYAFAQAWVKLNSWMLGPLRRGSVQRAAALKVELEQIRERYGTDSEGRMRAQMDLYKERNVNPLASCGWHVPWLVISELVILLTPRHQSLPELAAGIITVEW
jgi:uncharacterized RDD family membrane protein YckC